MLNKFKFLLFYTVYRKKELNMIYNDIKKLQTEINRKKEYLIVYTDQSSQWAFELVTVMCRYELGLAAC